MEWMKITTLSNIMTREVRI